MIERSCKIVSNPIKDIARETEENREALKENILIDSVKVAIISYSKEGDLRWPHKCRGGRVQENFL